MNNALSSSISAILPIQTATVGEYAHQTANARDLHSWLEVGKDFSTWIKNRIEQYDFTENVDYIKVPEAPQFGGALESTGYAQGKIEYHVTLDMGKELAMVERNDKGKEARKYFIECERRAKQSPQEVLDAYWQKFRKGASSNYNKLMDEVDYLFDRHTKERLTLQERQGRLNCLRASEANFLNRLVLGMESAEFRHWFNVFREPIRDSFPARMLNAMERAEQTDAMLLREDVKRPGRERYIRTMLEMEFPDVVNYRELVLAEKERLEELNHSEEPSLAPPKSYRELQAEATLLEHLNVQDIVLLSLTEATTELRAKRLEDSLREMNGH